MIERERNHLWTIKELLMASGGSRIEQYGIGRLPTLVIRPYDRKKLG